MFFAITFAQAIYPHNFEVDGKYYSYVSNENGKCIITYKGNSYGNADYSGVIEIPAEVTYNGKTYKVTAIADYAFCNCSGVSYVIMPESITSIGKEAFRNCTGLKDIDIPVNVTNFGSSPFIGCSNLKNITWRPKNFSDFYYANNTPFYDIRTQVERFYVEEEVTNIPAYLCDGMTNLIYLEFPYPAKYQYLTDCEKLQSIGKYAFRNCSSLGSLILPEGLKTINSYAFYGCTKLKNLYIPIKTTSIDAYSFYGCQELTSVNIPDRVTTIGNYAFANCPWVTEATIGRSVTSMGMHVFDYCKSLRTINWNSENHSDFNFWGSDALNRTPFYNIREQITSFNIDSSVKKIPVGLCYGMSSLTHVSIPIYVTSIGRYTFYGCSFLSSIIIPNYVTSIGTNAFEGCSNLNSINIPNSVTSIGSCAFKSCRNLNSIFIPRTTTFIGAGTFAGCSESLAITIESGNTKYVIDDGIMYNIDKTTIKFCPRSREGIFTIPNSVSSIDGYTFYGCSKLDAIDIPSTVTSIGSYAFSGCNKLIGISIPNGITTIPYAAFAFCSSLSSVEIPNNVTSVGNYAFWDCSSLSKISLPNGLTTIYDNAFEGCSSIETITIPKNAQTLGSNVFSKCTNLKTIYSYVTEPYSLNTSGSITNFVVTLYVPQGTTEIYKKTNNWNSFINIVEFDASAVENVRAEKQNATVTNVYSIDGIAQPQQVNGLNICRMSNGQVIKVLK